MLTILSISIIKWIVMIRLTRYVAWHWSTGTLTYIAAVSGLHAAALSLPPVSRNT